MTHTVRMLNKAIANERHRAILGGGGDKDHTISTVLAPDRARTGRQLDSRTWDEMPELAPIA